MASFQTATMTVMTMIVLTIDTLVGSQPEAVEGAFLILLDIVVILLLYYIVVPPIICYHIIINELTTIITITTIN